MKPTRTGIATLLGLSSFLLAMPARADYPALYWWRVSVNYSVPACFNRAEQAIREQGLQGVEVGKNDVYGHTDNSAVAVTCFKAGAQTQVVIMVTGSDTSEVKELRDGIKGSFE